MEQKCIWSYWSEARADGSVHGDGKGSMTTKDGALINLVGSGVGKAVGDGFEYRGTNVQSCLERRGTMRQEVLSLLAVGVVASMTTLGVQELTQTFVVNLKDPHPIEGEVTVPSPIPHSDMASMIDVVVAPAGRAETGLWTDVGTLETEGFTSVVLSLHGQLRGSTGGQGSVSLVLVPDEENILRAFAEGEVHLELEASADPVPSSTLYFSGASGRLPIGFPSYRVFLYNTTERSASVNVFAYLGN